MGRVRKNGGINREIVRKCLKEKKVNRWLRERKLFFGKGINQGRFAKVPVYPSPMYFKEILMFSVIFS